jgi:sugar/nucleoside kinase (ribokinase family)
VWDRIVAHDRPGEALERWGGIAYGVAAAAAACSDDWHVLPIVRVGRDLYPAAVEFLATIDGLDASGLLEVDEPTNRVELRYHSPSERTECLTGGVGPWAWTDLSSRIAGCDALLVNFVSGYEATLETARHLRADFDGPVYADLHSLFLGAASDGTRVPQRLEEPEAWVRCFDAVQMNEAEALLALPEGASADQALGAALEWGAALAVVTRGDDGVAWAARGGLPSDPLAWMAETLAHGARAVTGSVTISSALRGDPTGCGDVWGGAFFARLLAGDPIGTAAQTATRFAARNVVHRGADGLFQVLLHEVAT